MKATFLFTNVLKQKWRWAVRILQNLFQVQIHILIEHYISPLKEYWQKSNDLVVYTHMQILQHRLLVQQNRKSFRLLVCRNTNQRGKKITNVSVVCSAAKKKSLFLLVNLTCKRRLEKENNVQPSQTFCKSSICKTAKCGRFKFKLLHLVTKWVIFVRPSDIFRTSIK